MNEQFYSEFLRKRGTPANRTAEFGVKLKRNDPCPCDSGKKYKKCCQVDLEAAAGNRDNPLL